MNLRDQILMYAGRIVKWAAYSANNGFGRGYVQGPQEDQSLGEQPIQQPVRILQDFGFRSTPLVAGGESVTVAARGGPANAIAVVVDNQTVGPQDLEEGESCQYSSAYKDGDVCRIWLDRDGAIHIDANTGSNVIVNGGSASVARVGDACKIVPALHLLGPLGIWMSQVETAINILASGSVSPLSVTFTDDPGIEIKIGAPRFKA